MKWLILLLVTAQVFAYNEIKTEADFRTEDDRAKVHGKSEAKKIGEELKESKDLVRLAKRADWALSNMVERGFKELRKAGRSADVESLSAEWYFHYQGTVTRIEEAKALGRDIGDHQPLIK